MVYQIASCEEACRKKNRPLHHLGIHLSFLLGGKCGNTELLSGNLLLLFAGLNLL